MDVPSSTVHLKVNQRYGHHKKKPHLCCHVTIVFRKWKKLDT
ncbi:hypothetical protein ACJIZ3_005779 [Penstemon smallii]|uniref:Uncharacterized protein n=1 Tax=Penstemon smallii TaxID=265156 RepID=A0ABD3S5U7_9LAMI